MKNKILVTGGCGYIGSHTVVSLIENNFDVTILDDLSNSQEYVIDSIKEITGTKPYFLKCDLKNIDHLKNILKYHKGYDAIIHFAAHKAVGESVQDPLKYYQNNITGLINLLVCAKKYNIDNLIFSSSATVYGNPKSLPISEKNKTQRPFSPYGNSKKVAEEEDHRPEESDNLGRKLF